jgi:predicted RNA-binding protein with TRAM domain
MPDIYYHKLELMVNNCRKPVRMGEMYKRPYRVRKAAQRGKEVTIAPEAKLQPGDEVVQWCNGFVLMVPRGTTVGESLLR